MKTWWVYIVRCVDETLYTGITNNLEQRIDRHNAGNGAKYTKIRRPVTLVYAETAQTRGKAQMREAQIKKLRRAEKLDLIRTFDGQKPKS